MFNWIHKILQLGRMKPYENCLVNHHFTLVPIGVVFVHQCVLHIPSDSSQARDPSGEVGGSILVQRASQRAKRWFGFVAWRCSRLVSHLYSTRIRIQIPEPPIQPRDTQSEVESQQKRLVGLELETPAGGKGPFGIGLTFDFSWT